MCVCSDVRLAFTPATQRRGRQLVCFGRCNARLEPCWWSGRFDGFDDGVAAGV